jgi:transcription-repair coupling factor
MILVMNPLKMRRLVLRKIIMRKGIFWGYFPDNPQDKFYQSEKFKHLRNYLTQNPS